ncbi:hypothetical protein CHS0354_020750 [Potamilus streckersoni]|uniref:Uncharacterized protein n=1 Tax=Potamilus streckersoni TaxID=2493646 RepID=A0AAE0SCK8_9BIVA|nr:hypothetical protein CHS0354_020750 [Potamilus streckersoni]
MLPTTHEIALRNTMKELASKAGSPGGENNYKARKAQYTSLLHAIVAATTIQRLTGHNNTSKCE